MESPIAKLKTEGGCVGCPVPKEEVSSEGGRLPNLIFLFHFLVTESPIASQTHSDAPGGKGNSSSKRAGDGALSAPSSVRQVVHTPQSSAHKAHTTQHYLYG